MSNRIRKPQGELTLLTYEEARALNQQAVDQLNKAIEDGKRTFRPPPKGMSWRNVAPRDQPEFFAMEFTGTLWALWFQSGVYIDHDDIWSEETIGSEYYDDNFDGAWWDDKRQVWHYPPDVDLD